jgi:hypothetical protein
MHHSLLYEDGGSFIIQNSASIIQDTILTVAGIGIKCDIGHDAQIWEVFL